MQEEVLGTMSHKGNHMALHSIAGTHSFEEVSSKLKK